MDVRCLFDLRILSDFNLNRKENHGCVASGAYRYRKITLPGNPKARSVGQYPKCFMAVQLFFADATLVPCSLHRQPVSLSRIQSSWWCVPSSKLRLA